MRKVNEKDYRSFLEAWLHGDGSFIGVIMMGVKSIFFRLLIFRLLTFPCGYSWERDYNNLLFLMLIHNQIHNFCCRQVVPVPVLARTSTGRVGLRNAAVHEFTCSGEGRQSRFWECPQAARLLASVGDDGLLPGVSLLISTHGFLSALHRAGRLHQQALYVD